MEINGYDVFALELRYSNNDQLAIKLMSRTLGPYATLTVNLSESDDLEYGYAFVDINNCPWAEDFIYKYGLGEFTGKLADSGWCTYPLYKFDLDVLVRE